ncbi:MAG: hypothetical protein ACKVWV_19080 [Planctomycetota bacterium]
MRPLLLASSIVSLVASCARDRTAHAIPNGVYREPNGIESLTVADDAIEFHLRAEIDGEQGTVRRSYRYELKRENRIRIWGSSNDRFSLFVQVDHEWTWNGKSIERRGRRRGEVTTFARPR